ncbi:MAG TPA: hypothetical protein VFR78_05300 [Pyrinomonadaceae bacterium]|nr:hypothetical protein [Pyrinomonadaceae bacterium]
MSALIAAVLFTTLTNPCTQKPSEAVPQPDTGDVALLEHAICLARSDKNSPAYLLGAIAIRYAGLGQFDRAFELANSIDDEGERDLVRARIATSLNKSGETKRAIEILTSIQLFVETDGRKVPRYKSFITGEIAEQFAACGAFDRVFEVALSTDEDYLKRVALDAILDNFVIKQDFETLAKVVEASATLGNGEDGVIVSSVAQKYAEAGQYQKAITVANSLARTRDDFDDFNRDDAITNIALLLAKRGDFTRAVNLADSTDDYFKSQALIQIAKEQIAKGQSDAGVRLLVRVTSPLLKERYEEPDFDDAGIGAQRLAGAGVAYASAGYRDKAEKLLAIALDRAKRVRKFTERDQAIREVAVAYAEAGMFEQAADAARPDNFSYFKIAPLADVAIEMLRQHRDTEVREVVTMIRELRVKERSELQADALAEIAIKYLELGDRKSAAEVLTAAFEIARNAPVNDFQPGTMGKMAVALAEAGEYTKAIEVVAEIKSKFHQTLALAEIGVVQVKVGWVPDAHTMKILNGPQREE